MSIRVLSWLASDGYIVENLHFTGETKIDMGSSFGCQNWFGRIDFGAKSRPGDQFWQKFLPNFWRDRSETCSYVACKKLQDTIPAFLKI